MLPQFPKTISEWALLTQAFAMLCALLIVAGVSIIAYSWYWVSKANRTDAAIVSFERDKAESLNPILRYTDASGNSHQVVARAFGPSAIDDIGAVGDRVSILYQPEEPGNPRIDRFSDKWGMGLLMTTIAVFSTGLLGWTTRLLKKRIT